MNAPICGKDFKTGQTFIKTVLAPAFKTRMLGVSGWYSTNILGNRDGEVLDDPESFKTKEESKLGVLDVIFQPELYPDLYKDLYHKVRINYYPPRGDNKEGWDNIDIFGWLGYPMQLKVDFLCRDSILAAPLALDLILFMDLAARTPKPKRLGNPRMAQLLLQSSRQRPRSLPRARPLHPINEVKKYPPPHHGRRPHHPSRPRLLRRVVAQASFLTRKECSGKISGAFLLFLVSKPDSIDDKQSVDRHTPREAEDSRKPPVGFAPPSEAVGKPQEPGPAAERS